MNFVNWSRAMLSCSLCWGWILTALIVGVTGVSSRITWAVIRWHADVTRHPSIDSTQQTEQTFHFRKLSWEDFEKLKIPASQLLMKLANDKWLCVWLAFGRAEKQSWAMGFLPSSSSSTAKNIKIFSIHLLEGKLSETLLYDPLLLPSRYYEAGGCLIFINIRPCRS